VLVGRLSGQRAGAAEPEQEHAAKEPYEHRCRMVIPSLIQHKRDGRTLNPDTWAQLVWAYTSGKVPDYQISALLMAVFFRGMAPDELSALTDAMIASGDLLEWSGLGMPVADKHSTGGVGDKITIPLVPVVMACGGAVPQAAGRGLGHTGGTLDKLESIEGFTAEISKAQIRQQLCDIGAAIFAAGELAPADRKIYALRDVTATTESLPLIASSVMSKKIAEGAKALVLDSKVGSGAFLSTEAESRELARTMVELGTAAGLVTRALLTDMETPLGRTVGNAVEVEESLEVLAGGGPADVVQLTLALATEMLDAAGLDGIDPAETLKDGSAMDRFRALVAAQGGDLSRPLPIGANSETISAPRDGTMGNIDAMAVGLTVWRLGAGRSFPGERVQSGAGLRIHRCPREPVAAGEALFTLYTDTPERFGAAMAEMDGAWTVGDDAPSDRPLIIDRVGP
jgi:thymidine phosphorylase